MTTQQLTAAQTEYAARQARIQALMASLAQGLDAHATRAAGQPGNWGFAGDLGSIESELKDLVERLGG